MKLILIILTFLSSNAFAQQEEAGIRKTIDALFLGMKTSDTAMVRACFAPGAQLQSVVSSGEGHTKLVNEPVDSFLVALAKPHKELYDERISYDLVRIDGALAIVWAPYKFYLGTAFSHCGVDSFQLAWINGSWKIIYLADTRRKQPCD